MEKYDFFEREATDATISGKKALISRQKESALEFILKAPLYKMIHIYNLIYFNTIIHFMPVYPQKYPSISFYKNISERVRSPVAGDRRDQVVICRDHFPVFGIRHPDHLINILLVISV